MRPFWHFFLADVAGFSADTSGSRLAAGVGTEFVYSDAGGCLQIRRVDESHCRKSGKHERALGDSHDHRLQSLPCAGCPVM